MRKKILSLILLVTVCISGCGLSSSKGSSSGGGGVKILFTYSQEEGNAFRDTLAEGAQEYAESVGAVVECDYAENSLEKQIESIKSAQSNGYDAIMCIAEDATTARQLEAAAGDLPIIFCNNAPDDATLKEDKYIYCASDEGVAGQLQAEYILNMFSSKDEINVLLLKGIDGHSATVGRTKTLKEGLNASGKKINYVFEDFADFDTDTARKYVNFAVSKGIKFDIIVCNNDAMARGAIQACQDNNINLSDMPILGVDATQDGCEAILAGEMVFTVYQPAAPQGAEAAKAAIELANGGSISDFESISSDKLHLWVPFESVDASNAKDYL
ncbi:sugar ABC transporter substrate-binding protein [Pseudobutyrivibrio ruminis]|uniref:Inositol transport system substrate-binding protein n=1 Tax=Pseudobutyrivibrio ruminis DSM 9787 TaxID=1123011 RepID=A0A285RV47_9FIRM|nr:sugar ABC transporter substrate-binding protein [Pseudobutyrivibrio ruminis]SOB98279.1 inositol transport system substrate-binding protein [Pseudobutyrivibrio ruminis DSM 9787]